MYLKHLVFVYGTLKRGCSNHFFLEEARCLGRGRTLHAYALYEGEYPFVIREEHLTPIQGEVYEVDGQTLQRLDRLEEHPDYYRRDQVDVVLEDGSKLLAWLYFFPTPRGRFIESGEWLPVRP
jgi:gamma-glutamylcyclotransferase (GGCT)/AIG2-like uncharacterized protein YtfP